MMARKQIGDDGVSMTSPRSAQDRKASEDIRSAASGRLKKLIQGDESRGSTKTMANKGDRGLEVYASQARKAKAPKMQDAAESTILKRTKKGLGGY